MAPYKEMYCELFRSVTKAIEILQQAQARMEEMYINADSSHLSLYTLEKQPAPQNIPKTKV